MPPLMDASEVRHTIQQRAAERVWAMRQRPLVRIWDKDWGDGTTPGKPKAIIFGETDCDHEEILNETGEANLGLFGNHRLRDWLIDEIAEEEDVHLTIDYPATGYRWHGKAHTITEKGVASGVEYVRLNFLHGIQHAKKITCFSNPVLPPQFQWPKQYLWAGPSAYGIRSVLFLNLLRRFGPLWALPDNIFDGDSWLLNLDPSNWGQVVMPGAGGLLGDTSMWTTFTTRWGNFFDVVTPILRDSGLQLIATRWLPGDPQPAPSHFFLTKPTLVWDIRDVSGVRGPSGTILDGLLKLGSAILEDGISEVHSILDLPNADEYSTPGFFGVVQTHPWIVWRRGMRAGINPSITRSGVSGISEWEMTIHKALAGAITTGGKSPSYINAAVKLLLNGVLGYIGMLFGNPGLALGIFDKQVEDVILAFIRVPHPLRQAAMGSDSYGEHWENGGVNGFSLSTLQAVRIGLWNTRAYTSFKIGGIVNAAPYAVGRHFTVGDRAGAEIGRSGRVYVDQIHAIRGSWSRSKNVTWEISLGTDAEEQPPGAMLGRQVEQIRSLIQANVVES